MFHIETEIVRQLNHTTHILDRVENLDNNNKYIMVIKKIGKFVLEISPIIMILALVWAYQTFGWAGMVAVLLFDSLFAGIIIYMNRNILKMQYFALETKLFGKPLQKQFWKKGEWEETRKNIKIVLWKKKDKEDKHGDKRRASKG